MFPASEGETTGESEATATRLRAELEAGEMRNLAVMIDVTNMFVCSFSESAWQR